MSATLPQRQTRSLAVTLLLLGACGGGGSGGPVDGAPVAHAGADQPTPLVGDVVFLDGSASADDDGDPLRFAWELAASPPGSAAALSDPGAPDPSFVADLAGEYVWRLTVSDGIADSEPDEVSVTVRVPPPVVTIGAPVDLEVVTSSPVTVTGTVDDPDATVTVNGVEAATAAGGYSASVALAEGANTVTAVARNGTGESEAAVEVILNTTANPKASITWPRSGFVVGEEFAMGAPFHAAQLTVSGVVKVNTSAFLPGNNKPVVLVGGVAASVSLSPFTGECTVINPFQCWSFTATLSVERGARTVSAVVTDVEGRGTTVSVGGVVDYCRKGQFDSEQSTPGKDPGVNALAGPSREVQGNRCHEIDGCSGPLGLGLANDPTPLAVCNEAATHFGVGTQPPEEHFVHGLSSAFDLPCNHHDVCYQTCVPVAGLSDAARESAWRAAWHRCNGDQLARAQQVCRRAFPSPLCTSSPSAACLLAGGCGKYLQERALCFGSASIAFQAVESEKGYERFRERQADSCAG